MKVEDRVKIVQGKFDGVQPSLVGLEGTVTSVWPATKYISVLYAEVVFVDGTKRVFYKDEMKLVPAD